MLTSLGVIFVFGLLAGGVTKKVGIPALFGMIVAGILLGPHGFGLLDEKLLAVSSDLRKMALLIILTRAGLSLDLEDLLKVGRPAVLLCFLPATLEIIGATFLGPGLLGLSTLEGALLGTVIAAVSPAVVVPKMLRLMEEGYGRDKNIPQMILAGASVDDVFVIVLFSVFTTLVQGGTVKAASFLAIPLSLVTGIVAGLILGKLLAIFLERMDFALPVEIMIFLSLSFFLAGAEEVSPVPFSGLLAVMFAGIAFARETPHRALQLSRGYNGLWAAGEVLLFVLLGAEVNIAYALGAGIGPVALVLGAMAFRMAGVFLALLGTPLNGRERLFTMLAYTPKATVQAAIGGVPLALGLSSGPMILTVAVVAILITAPFGAFAIERGHKKLLKG